MMFCYFSLYIYIYPNQSSFILFNLYVHYSRIIYIYTRGEAIYCCFGNEELIDGRLPEVHFVRPLYTKYTIISIKYK